MTKLVTERVTTREGFRFATPWRLVDRQWQRLIDVSPGCPLAGLLPNGSMLMLGSHGFDGVVLYGPDLDAPPCPCLDGPGFLQHQRMCCGLDIVAEPRPQKR